MGLGGPLAEAEEEPVPLRVPVPARAPLRPLRGALRVLVRVRPRLPRRRELRELGLPAAQQACELADEAARGQRFEAAHLTTRTTRTHHAIKRGRESK